MTLVGLDSLCLNPGGPPSSLPPTRRSFIERTVAASFAVTGTSIIISPPDPAFAYGQSAKQSGPAFIPSPITPTDPNCLVKDMFSDTCLESKPQSSAYSSSVSQVSSDRRATSLQKLPSLRPKILLLQKMTISNKLGQASNEIPNIAGIIVPVVDGIDKEKGSQLKAGFVQLGKACAKKDQNE
eukprot:CAMPEP_0182500324 /NCGR_PEP_ID=MMETSP1321-20130603/8874_1 /TAXON_ID=91990 /ORGANISM="Bolidomonas sp., Strain RCC1657" /LENGTH=182 /DNA_ID=CAMNT_0024704715 /DNA_START=67 /DNA_END=612 /DNA_ORIENTATION=-